MRGSYDEDVIKYERRRIRVKKQYPCGCAILENGECVFCLKHWSRERIKKKMTEEEMDEICEGDDEL